MKKAFIRIIFLLAGLNVMVYSQIEFYGEFSKRIELVEKRLNNDSPYELDLVVQDVARVPENKRRFEEYEGDISGRILGAWSSMARITDERPTKLDSIAERVLQYQHPEGYFGINQKIIGWDYWGRQIFGHGRLLLGLVEYYKLSGDERFLESAKKLGAYLVKAVPELTTTHEGNPWTDTRRTVDWSNSDSNRRHFVKTHQTSILEGLVSLYKIAPDPDLLKTAEYLVSLFPEFGTYHSHSYMNTMVGMVMLYQVNQDHELLHKILDIYWQKILPKGIRMDGAVCEFFPDDERTEGCSLTDWVRLNLYLWDVTHEAVYLDQVEQCWLNSLYYHQTANGAFGHAFLTHEGYGDRYSESWWCCLMHGLYAFADIAERCVVRDNETLYINFYTSLDLKSTDTIMDEIKIETEYPEKGKVKIELSALTNNRSVCKVRIPDWVEDYNISVNGKAVDAKRDNGYLVLNGEWNTNDIIELSFENGLRFVDGAGNNIQDRRSIDEITEPVYFFHGPMLLMIDNNINNQFPNYINLDIKKAYTEHKNHEPQYTFPAANKSGEFKVVMVPLKDETWNDKWTDEWKNFIRNGETPIKRHDIKIKQKIKKVE